MTEPIAARRRPARLSHPDHSPSHRRVTALLLALTAFALLAAGALAACGDEGVGDTAASDDRFAGTWAPVDARLEIGWNDGEKWYGISLAGDGESYGGLVVEKNGADYAVTMVGIGGAATDAFPATVNGDVLSFEMPVMDTPTPMSLTLTGEGAADMSFGDAGEPWAFTKVDSLVTETPSPSAD